MAAVTRVRSGVPSRSGVGTATTITSAAISTRGSAVNWARRSHTRSSRPGQRLVGNTGDVRPAVAQGLDLGRVGVDTDQAEALGPGRHQQGQADVAESDDPHRGAAVGDLSGQRGEARVKIRRNRFRTDSGMARRRQEKSTPCVFVPGFPDGYRAGRRGPQPA